MLPLDMSEVVNDFASPSGVRLIQTSPGLREKGRIDPSTQSQTSTDISACVYPTTGEETKMLPEARRTEQNLTFVSTSVISVANASAGTPADQLVYQGVTYEAHTLLNWNDDGSFCQVVAAKVGQ